MTDPPTTTVAPSDTEGRSSQDRLFHPTWQVRVFRRGLHIFGVAFLVYYLLPATLFGLPTWWALIVGALGLVGLEGGRLGGLWTLPSIRPHEEHHVASYVLWGTSILILLAFFPRGVTIPALAGAALVDPLAGELRARDSWPSWLRLGLPPVTYLAIFGGLLEVVTAPSALLLVPLVAIPSAGAIVVEGRAGRHLDDDLWMPLLPALLLVFLAAVIPGAPHLPLQWPWVGP